MVGILLSYWDDLFSGAMLVSGRVYNLNVPCKQQGQKKRHVKHRPAPGSWLVPTSWDVCRPKHSCASLGGPDFLRIDGLKGS